LDAITHTFTRDYFVFATLDITANGTVIPEEMEQLVKRLRFSLRDFNPDLHYTLFPMIDVETRERKESPQAVLWEDEELVIALEDGLDALNVEAPLTNFDFKNVRPQYRHWLTHLGRIFLIKAKSLNWVAQDMSFNLTTNSLDISRYEKYARIAENELNTFNSQFPNIKRSIEKKIRGTGRFFRNGAPRVRPFRLT